MTNGQKTKPRGDRVVYTYRVVVESAKWVKLVMEQFTYGNPNPQNHKKVGTFQMNKVPAKNKGELVMVPMRKSKGARWHST
ncbi:hypothetical protein Hanom_Chr11g01024341 [Helianthus anomalus]